jgi:hypothetical protein
LQVSTTAELPRYSVRPRRALKVATRIGKGTKKLVEIPLTGAFSGQLPEGTEIKSVSDLLQKKRNTHTKTEHPAIMKTFETGWLTYEKAEYLNAEVNATDVVFLSLYVTPISFYNNSFP